MTPEEEKTLNQNIVRVGGNLMVLLDIGLFPGKFGVSLEEAKGMIKSVIDDAQKRLEPKIVPPPAPIDTAVV